MKLPKSFLYKTASGFEWALGWLLLRKSKDTFIFRIHPGPPGTSALFMVWLQLWKRLAIFLPFIKFEITIR